MVCDAAFWTVRYYSVVVHVGDNLDDLHFVSEGLLGYNRRRVEWLQRAV